MPFLFIFPILQWKCTCSGVYANKNNTALKMEQTGVCSFFVTDESLFGGLKNDLWTKKGISLVFKESDSVHLRHEAKIDLFNTLQLIELDAKDIFTYFLSRDGACYEINVPLLYAKPFVYEKIFGFFATCLKIESLSIPFHSPPSLLQKDGKGFSLKIRNISNNILRGVIIYHGILWKHIVVEGKESDILYFAESRCITIFFQDPDLEMSLSHGTIVILLHNDNTMSVSEITRF